MTTIICPTSEVFSDSPIEPCSANVSGPGLDESITVNYSNNFNAGTATAEAAYAGGINWLGSSDSTTFEISKAPTSVDVDCPSSRDFTGSPIEPCDADITGPGLDESIPVTYSNNVNAGTATATGTYDGNSNYLPSEGTDTFQINPDYVRRCRLNPNPPTYAYDGQPHGIIGECDTNTSGSYNRPLGLISTTFTNVGVYPNTLLF